MVEIRYFSKSGNTKAIAQSIAAAVGAEAHDISTPLSGKADILFLGGAVYAFRIAGKLKKFIKTLSPEAVGKSRGFQHGRKSGRRVAAHQKAAAEMRYRAGRRGVSLRGADWQRMKRCKNRRHSLRGRL